MQNIYTFLLYGFLLLFIIFSIHAQEDNIDNQQYLHPNTALLYIGIDSGKFNPAILPDNPMQNFSKIGYIIPHHTRQQLENKVENPWMSIGGFALCIVQVYDLSTGLLYSLIPSEHYALKELQYRGIIDNSIHPAQPISGKQAMQIIEQLKEILNTNNGDTS